MADIRNPPINQLPLGLLSLLDIKTGRYPQLLGADALIPTIDLLQWYLTSDSIFAQLTANGSPFAASQSAGFNDGFTASTNTVLPIEGTQIRVPAGELWWVERFTTRWTIASDVGNLVDVSPIVQIPTVGTIDLENTLQGSIGPGIAANSRGGSRNARPQMFWPPGSAPRFFVNILDRSAGSIAVIGEIQLKRLRL